jgi:hypothetical protein
MKFLLTEIKYNIKFLLTEIAVPIGYCDVTNIKPEDLTCISFFSMIGLRNQGKPCRQGFLAFPESFWQSQNRLHGDKR